MHPHTAIPCDFVLTPHGLRHKDCVHLDEDGTYQFEHCRNVPPPRPLPPNPPGGWIESATFPPSEPLQKLIARFEVPDPPMLREASLVYLFPAAQNGRGTTILQPVLQWGCNNRFGSSESWVVACWHCTPHGHSRHSTPIEVMPHDVIFARIEATTPYLDAYDWIVEARVNDDPFRETKLHVRSEKDLMLFIAAGALEVYSLETLEQPMEWQAYPATGETTFSHIELHDLNGLPYRADWNSRYPRTRDGFDVHISDDRGSVTLTYS